MKKPTRKPAAKKPTKKPAAKQPPTPRKGFVSKQAKAAANAATGLSAPKLIDAKIAALGDWRGDMLSRLRAIVKAADPDIVEEMKWGDVPVWSHHGILTTGETYKAAVKLTFAKGASLPDPKKLFNASLGGGTRRAIDFGEGAAIDEAALTALIRAAIALNQTKKR